VETPGPVDGRAPAGSGFIACPRASRRMVKVHCHTEQPLSPKVWARLQIITYTSTRTESAVAGDSRRAAIKVARMGLVSR